MRKGLCLVVHKLRSEDLMDQAGILDVTQCLHSGDRVTWMSKAMNMLSAPEGRIAKHLAVTIYVLILSLGYAYGADPNAQDAQERALNMITGAAEKICQNPPLEQTEESLRLTGEAKAELSKALKEVADIGISGVGEYVRSSKKQSILQKQIAESIKNSNDCRYAVFVQLKNIVLSIPNDNSTEEQYKDKDGPKISIGPSKITYKAKFDTWQNKKSDYGYSGPTGGRSPDYSLIPNSPTWIGSGYIDIGSISRNFKFDISFKMTAGDCSLGIALSEAGGDQHRLEFTYSSWNGKYPTFSINDSWIDKNFYKKLGKKISNRTPLPDMENIFKSHERNIISIKRSGSDMGFYLNDILLKHFESAVFEFAKLFVQASGPCKIILNSVEIQEPID